MKTEPRKTVCVVIQNLRLSRSEKGGQHMLVVFGLLFVVMVLVMVLCKNSPPGQMW